MNSELNSLTPEQLKQFVFDYEKTYISNRRLAYKYELFPRNKDEYVTTRVKRIAKELNLKRLPDFQTRYDVDMRVLKERYESGMYSKSALSRIYKLPMSQIDRFAKKFKWSQEAYSTVNVCADPENYKRCSKCKYYDDKIECCDYLRLAGEMRNCNVRDCTKFKRMSKEDRVERLQRCTPKIFRKMPKEAWI